MRCCESHGAGERRLIQIATRQSGAADHEFARYTDAAQLAVRLKNVDVVSGHRMANGHRRVGGKQLDERGHHAVFRRAVFVE